MQVFDEARDRSHASDRECMGLNTVWERGSGVSRDLFGKNLSFYACGNDGRLVSEIKFVKFLSGLSIENEFDALIGE